jgi:hypothetical protein
MEISVSHSREQETAKSKALWFQSLSLAERMDYLCSITDLILENNRSVADKQNAQSTSGRVRVLSIK